MPTYKITDPTSGKVIRVTGDAPPSADDVEELFNHPATNNEPDTKSAMFPRTAQGAEQGKSYPRQVANAGADLLSLPGRGVAATFDKSRPFKESLADTKGSGIVSQTVRDPGTGAAILTAPISGPLTAGFKGAELLGMLAKGAISGAVQGAGSAVAHQAENVGAGKPVSLKDAALETATNAAIPVGTGVAGEAVSKVSGAVGKKILESAIKPAKKIAQNIGSKFNIQNAFDLGLDSPLGLKAMDEKIAAYHDDLGKRYGDELKAVGGGVFNAGTAFSEALKKSAVRMAKGGLTPEEEAGIQHGAQTWQDYLNNSEFVKNVSQKTSPNLPPNVTQIPPDAAIAIRKAVQKAAKFDRTDPKAVKGAELFAQDLQSSMNEQLSQKFPSLRPLDAEYSKLYPIEKGVADATTRTAKNYGISLLDLGGLAATGYGLATGDQHETLGGLGSLLLTRGVRSPGVASALYRGGKVLAAGSKTNSALAALAGRGTAQNFRQEDQ